MLPVGSSGFLICPVPLWFSQHLNNPTSPPLQAFEWYPSKATDCQSDFWLPFVKSSWVWRMVSHEGTVGQCVDWNIETGHRSAPREWCSHPWPRTQLPCCSVMLWPHSTVFLCPTRLLPSASLLVCNAPKPLVPSGQISVIFNEGQAVCKLLSCQGSLLVGLTSP